MSTSGKYLIAILGPTASGKTALSVELAKRLNTEILSFDSRQFYKEMNIGTAKVTEDEMQGVPHHFIGHVSIEDEYSAGDFERGANIHLLVKLT
jgi:tRNA dimethylallyltransferase